MAEGADPIDFASDLSERARAHGEAEVRLRAIPKQVKVDGRWPVKGCEECGDEIPDERLEATGAVTCIACATILEKKGKQYGK